MKWLAASWLLLAPLAGAQALISSPVPGGVVLLEIGASPTASPTAPVATFEGRRVMVLRSGDSWQAVVGLALAAPLGRHSLDVRQADGSHKLLSFDVVDKRYAEQRLKVPPAQGNLSKKDLARVLVEQKRIGSAMVTFTADP